MVRASRPKSWRRCASCSANTRAGPAETSTTAADPAPTDRIKAVPLVARVASGAVDPATRARNDSIGPAETAVSPPAGAARVPTGSARAPSAVARVPTAADCVPIAAAHAPIVAHRGRITVRERRTGFGGKAAFGRIAIATEGRAPGPSGRIAQGAQTAPTVRHEPDPPARGLGPRSRFRFWSSSRSSGFGRFSPRIK